jgi:hypothetical protein
VAGSPNRGKRPLSKRVKHHFHGPSGVVKHSSMYSAHVSSFPLVPRTPQDATLTAADQRRRAALLSAIAAPAVGWPETDRTMAAAILDVLWGVMSYDRLVAAWELTPQQATRALTWAMGLVEAAIREGRGPDDGPMTLA